ncbi:MAG TPA: single-stranded DNA-binding protein [Parasegetibacter sp.]
MNSMRNKVQLVGNLGTDPEIKLLESGKKRARISLATNDIYKSGEGETVRETQWHQVIAWGKLADKAEKYLKKGSELFIEGRLHTRDYIDKEGNKRYITEVVASSLLPIVKSEEED